MAKNESALSRVSAMQKGQPVNANKQNCHIARYYFDNSVNRSKLLQYGKEGVVIYESYFRDFKPKR